MRRPIQNTDCGAPPLRPTERPDKKSLRERFGSVNFSQT